MNVPERARELLEEALGSGTEFHPGQLEAIVALVQDRARVLVVQPTGWGKSIVYLIATALLRELGRGPTILISPLLALMRDQLLMAERIGVRADTINSSNTDEWTQVEEALAADQLDILLVSPERLANERFRMQVLPSIRLAIGLFVVDEAHCISDWGHDFRPDYRRIRVLVDGLPENVPLLATTATANDRVVADITDQLGERLTLIRGALDRESLHLQVVSLASQAERLAWLSRYIDTQQGSGIVYVLTVGDAHRVSEWLLSRGIDAPAYTGQCDTEERETLERRLRSNEVKALVATVALGMGFDKPDVSFVVRAEVVLLAGTEDDAIAEYFTDSAAPPEEELRAILDALQDVEEAGEKELLQSLNIGKGALQRDLKLLEVDGAIVRSEHGYARTPKPWVRDGERVEAVREVRIAERERMAELVTSSSCLMELLRTELDDPDASPCGRCANCAGPFAPMTVEPTELRAALEFLERSYRPIEPRKRWPAEMDGRKRGIPPEHQLHEGRSLCLYGDPIWGGLVRAGKYADGRFDDRLVDAVAEMLQNHLHLDVMPTWVTAVPSRRAPELVDDFAKRLARRLGLPYRQALEKKADAPQQKTMQNSYHQARNALDSFAAIPANVIPKPVLLVDDMVDSRWSLTVCGILLAEAGSGPVVPVALAESTARGQE
jgi:ATP-dependent DNA helicase RecQ